MVDPYVIAKPLLHRLDPETAHEIALRALAAGLVPRQPAAGDPILATTLFGRAIANPIGLAAGFDKNARVYGRMPEQGFGFTEIGGVTPLPQAGNPRPRVFRLPADAAVINRMGFPNDGAAAVEARLRAGGRAGVLGINLASNITAADPIEDFAALVARFAPYADFLTLDISCPNTANGQVFLEPAALRRLLARIATIPLGPAPPAIVAKLAPDVDDERLAELVAVLEAAGVDGLVLCNTTALRPPLRDAERAERGGLSGRPLFARSTEVLRAVARIVRGRLALIGVGGVASGDDAFAKIAAGADAVQLYTALVYGGTALVTRIKRDLAARLRREGFATVRDAVGTAAWR